MDLKVFWTDTAIEKLEEIFDHYKTKASLEVAQRIVNSIVDATIRLETHPAQVCWRECRESTKLKRQSSFHRSLWRS